MTNRSSEMGKMNKTDLDMHWNHVSAMNMGEKSFH